MDDHTFDPAEADRLNDPWRFAFLSVDEVLATLALSDDAVVADLGSGTGFYTDHVASASGQVLAIDGQVAMHAHYRTRGVPENVTLVTAAIGALPVPDSALDTAVSTMTLHEFASPTAVSGIATALEAGGRFVVADWTATGTGEAGPPVGERFECAGAVSLLEDAGFTVESATDRRETFLISATAPA